MRRQKSTTNTKKWGVKVGKKIYSFSQIVFRLGDYTIDLPTDIFRTFLDWLEGRACFGHFIIQSSVKGTVKLFMR